MGGIYGFVHGCTLAQHTLLRMRQAVDLPL